MTDDAGLEKLLKVAYEKGLAEGRKAGLEEAAKFTEDYGLELFAKADGSVSLRHGAVLLSSFAIKIRGLGPPRDYCRTKGLRHEY